MKNKKEICCHFSIDNVEFMGTKVSCGYDSVLNDFKNAKTVRILTYSAIPERQLQHLGKISNSSNVKIIVGMPNTHEIYDVDAGYTNTFDENNIDKDIDKLKLLLEWKNNKLVKTSISVCFLNHAKIIGTENILYVGSANYSNQSTYNYEAGFIIKDKEAIQIIYKEYFDEVMSIELKGDRYDKLRHPFEYLREKTDSFYSIIIDFTGFGGLDDTKDIDRNFKELQKIVDLISDIIEKEQSDNVYLEFQDDVETIKSYFSDIEEIINDNDYIQTGYDIEYYAEQYEERNQSAKNVHCEDAYLEDGSRYVPLREDWDRESFIVNNWNEDVSQDKDIQKLIDTLENCMEEINSIVDKLSKLDSLDKRISEVKRQGSDPNAIK